MKRRNARRKPVPPDLQSMVAQYIETALWSSTDDGGEPLDRTFGPEHVSVRFHNVAVTTCGAFIAAVEEKGLTVDLANVAESMEGIGHDLWLTQNRHGAGFWDGDYDRGDELTAVAHTFGCVDLYVYRGRVTC